MDAPFSCFAFIEDANVASQGMMRGLGYRPVEGCDYLWLGVEGIEEGVDCER